VECGAGGLGVGAAMGASITWRQAAIRGGAAREAVEGSNQRRGASAARGGAPALISSAVLAGLMPRHAASSVAVATTSSYTLNI
jgi:hypothetical protein